jgi:hypothetical protein
VDLGPVWQDSSSSKNSSGSGSSEEVALLKQLKLFLKTFGKTALLISLEWVKDGKYL